MLNNSKRANYLYSIYAWILSHQTILLLSLITGTGIFLRFYTLGLESIWFDEAASIYSAENPLVVMLMECVGGHRHPPLHFFLLKIWIMLFGDSEFSVRSLSAIFGSASIPLIFLVGKRLFNSKTGLIASFLLSISLFAIFFSQETRAYAMLLFFTLLSFYFFIRIITERAANKKLFIAYSLANVLLIYTHYFGLFAVASQLFYFFLARRRYADNEKRFWISSAATGIIFFPWAVVFVAFSIPRSYSWERPDLNDIFGTLASYSGYNGNNAKWLLLIFGCLIIFGLLSWIIMKRREPAADFIKIRLAGKFNLSINLNICLIIVWLAFPIVVPFLISQIPLDKTGIYITRYTISALPAFLLLAANGIEKFLSRKILYPIFALIVIVISWFSVTDLQHYYSTPQKEQWREAVNLIESSIQPGDVILVNEWYFFKAVKYYAETDLATQTLDAGMEEQEINQFKADGKERMWLIQVNWGSRDTIKYLERMSDEYPLIIKEQFVSICVYLFDLNDLTTEIIQQ